MKSVFVVTLLLAASPMLTGQLTAQSDEHEQFRVTERALRQNSAEVEHLLDLRMRHDLGLIAGLDENIVRIEKPMNTREMSVGRRELEKLQNDTQYYRTQYERLAAQARLLAAAANSANEQYPVVGRSVPAAGSSIGDREPVTTRPIASPRTPTPAAPGVETAPQRGGSNNFGSLTLDPLKAQIHGSTDHLRVAKALFKVGQALLERAEELRSQGQPQAAKELDARAKIKLDLAVTELAPLLKSKEPDFVSLFYLGRCREQLFRYSERYDGLALDTAQREFQRREQEVRDPFLQITARDVVKTGVAETEVLGLWGQAAKTAMEHFRWMNVHAGFDQTAKIQSLTWPGERNL
tara:strand:- start:80391 stop:81443 length:1053 start_codon:yes stop_codon:yes gene_type:complete